MAKLLELKYNLNYIMIGIHKISDSIKQDKNKLDGIQESIIQLFEIVNLYENKDMVSVSDLNLVIDDVRESFQIFLNIAHVIIMKQ